MSRAPAMRLDRLLANLGYGSRREVQAMIGAGQIALDGERLRDIGLKVPITPDLGEHLRVRGAPLDPPPPLTLILHKPLGVVCSHREPGRSGRADTPVFFHFCCPIGEADGQKLRFNRKKDDARVLGT